MTLRVRDLDESGLLARIVPLLPTGAATLVGPGDDAAVVAAPDGRYVVSTDVLVEDFHFRHRWSTGYDVGVRAAAQNLADVAAMGGRPTALVVGLAMPGDLEVAWVEGLARGLADACSPVGAAVVGGDLSGGSVVMVSVAVHGDLGGRPPVLRSGARPGDVVAHAGVRGRSAAGLALLEAGAASPGDGAPGAAGPLAPFVTGFLRPAPPLDQGPAANAAGATAMLDVSDGLLRDAGRIAAASGVVVDLERGALQPYVAELLPAAAALGDAADRASDRALARALTWVLAGGEDHGLLATFPPDVTLPDGFTRLGAVRPADPAAGVTLDGMPPQTSPGWDHFHQ
ncbi:thiamine-monophosphate kinase [Xylanimonas cellulosilytica DSM 15894]|uniref:Thiamine-monophosphate kinase n=1 Tax=Xylanimonas cellulosilytica (strain DSM 15894 / JCM 12276 / CECT 5975 / KCTC 9989 / LMG 20990 / NBRC 107835 / XIL07) TaxID=446471 RepID=D1BV62_XYLCX|nr:thiamine-phosphate kinase [Xylanimonas cellulosilytica]ACZ31301.1 thiamine-monophosphate kinase [Xylanimonas cellulosilytica DSM 15894]